MKRTVLAANGIWIAGSLAVFLAIHFLIQYLWLRRIGKFGMLLGNLVIWALAAAATAPLLPNAQYVFLWPLIGCALGALTEVFAARKKPGNPGFYTVFTGVFCVLIYLPVGYILFQALMMSGSYAAFAILSLPVTTIMMGLWSLFSKK